MKRYKVGDKVKLVEHHRDSDENDGLDIGSVGTVTRVNPDAFDWDEEEGEMGQPYYVDWPDTHYGGWWVCAECLGDVKPISLENK